MPDSPAIGMDTAYDGITPDLERIAGQLRNPRGLMGALGVELQRTLRDHFFGRGGVYAQIGRAVSKPEFDETSATVTVVEPVGKILIHKINGGVVKPITGRMLAIPARPEARTLGWPRMWDPGHEKMEMLFGRGGVPVALALAQSFSGKRGGKFNTHAAKAGTPTGGGGVGLIMYWLKYSVTHRPDPQALPDEETVNDRLRDRAEQYLADAKDGRSARQEG